MKIDPDRLAELEEERRFLLRSLDDLEREHEFGDVTDEDYRTLQDGYTARAATVMRAIEEGRAALPPKKPRRVGVIVASVVGVVAVAVLAGWLVARSSGQRLEGQTMTGGQEVDSVTAKLAEARSLLGRDAQATAQLYREVLDIEPDNAEARTYTAWLLALSSAGASEDIAALALDEARAGFESVIADNPGYADAHCLYVVMAASILPEPDLDLAREQGELCLASNPPSEMVDLVEPFLDSLPTAATTP